MKTSSFTQSVLSIIAATLIGLLPALAHDVVIPGYLGRSGDLGGSPAAKTPSVKPLPYTRSETSSASVSLVGAYTVLYDIPKYPAAGCNTANVWLDGAISPVSYRNPPTSSTVTINIIAAHPAHNESLIGTINPNGTITTLSQPSGCTDPAFVSAYSTSNNAFTWGEWLYGIFFNVPLHKTYATIYNEYYGPQGFSQPPNKTGWYSADGLAFSLDYGATFSRIATPPNHVIARPTFLFTPGPSDQQIGYGGISSIVLSPKDNYFYGLVHWESQDLSASRFVLMRTSNLDDPSSWRAWNGGSFTGNIPAGYDPSSTAAIGVTVFPLYLGWSQYYQRFIAAGWQFGDNSKWDFALSDDLIHWDQPIKIMDSPSPDDNLYGYPSLLDPGLMLNTNDSRAASGNLIGQTPYLSYIHQNLGSGTAPRQEIRIQKLQFSGAAPSPTPIAVTNLSARAIVGPGDKNLIVGFRVGGAGNSRPKTLVIRGIGPSLGSGSLPTPTISVYNSSGTLIATNHGWTNLSSTNQALLGVLAPTNANDSAVVYGNFTPGQYTAVLNGGSGLGLIDLYDVTWQSPDPAENSALTNISARGYVQAGSGSIIVGFTTRRGRTMDVRATSISTLGPAGFSPVLADPTLTCYKGSTQTDYNDNWQTDPDHVAIMNDGLAPGNSLESALRPPVASAGGYTVICAGKSNAPDGYAIVELYDVSP